MFFTLLFISLILLTFLIIIALQKTEDRNNPTVDSSPVAWIDSAVWNNLASKKRFPQLRGDKVGRFKQTSGIVDPQLLRASPWDHERISPMQQPIHLPPRRSESALLNELLTTPNRIHLKSPIWPICCEDLATLINSQGSGLSLETIENKWGSLDQSFLEYELAQWGGDRANPQNFFAQGWSQILHEIRSGEHNNQGLNIFECHHCKRHYVASCSPSQ